MYIILIFSMRWGGLGGLVPPGRKFNVWEGGGLVPLRPRSYSV